MLIEPHVSGWMEMLCARSPAVADDEHLYLLVDGAFIPGIHRHIHPERKAMLFASLPGCSSEALDMSPFLTPWDAQNKNLRRLLERCSGWPMVSVIQTGEPLPKLAARLAAWSVVEADGQRFHLRYADTRRLPAIVEAMSGEQRAQMLGPAVNWAYSGRDGAWHQLRFDGADTDAAAHPSFDERQFGTLVEDSRVDEMLALFAQRDAGPPKPPLQSYQLVSQALAIASGASLPDAELLAWCEFVWHEGVTQPISTLPSRFAHWRTTR